MGFCSLKACCVRGVLGVCFRTSLESRQVNNIDNGMHATYLLDFSQNSGLFFVHTLLLCGFLLQLVGCFLFYFYV